MLQINLNANWDFRFNSQESWTRQHRSQVGRTVQLPHDWTIEQLRDPSAPSGSSGAYYRGGIGVYTKALFAPKEWSGKRVQLYFDGVYRHAEVRVNRDLMALHPGGYTAFFVDITDALRVGEDNQLEIKVNHSALPSSRWYTGAGIYRDVMLLVSEQTHIAPWGVFVRTPNAAAEGTTVLVETTLCTNQAKQCVLNSRVCDTSGNIIVVDSTAVLLQGGKQQVKQELKVTSCTLWSPENPVLYTIQSELMCEDVLVDSATTRFGMRTIEVDAQAGLRINGVSTLLKGGCVHHDNGLLGSRSFADSERRKVRLLQESGYNAIRCAHNPPSTAFLEACDEMGMLVIDEAFDCWREGKKLNDEHLFFEDWWERDLKSMVLRDRNHPCIILWSTGNEIVERSGISDGYAWSRKLADAVRALDDTRPITNALCGFFEDPDIALLAANSLSTSGEGKDYWAEKSEDFIAPLDVAGYNYLNDRYEKDGKLFPNRVICGTESFPNKMLENWRAVEKLPFVIGDFTWTSWDYLGEAGIGHAWYDDNKEFMGKYPWHLANCGDLDICGFKRPQSYYRDLMWGVSKIPFIAVHDPAHHGQKPIISSWGWPDVAASWNWSGSENKPIAVDVYAVGDFVELFLNGASQGKQPCKDLTASFELVYQPGLLEAVSYQSTEEIGRNSIKTTGAPFKLRLTADRMQLSPAYGNLSFVTVEVVDEQGDRVTDAKNAVHVTAHGAGTLLALGTADPVSEEGYVVGSRKAHQGRLMAVVSALDHAGELCINVQSEGLIPAGLQLIVGK